MKRSNRVILLFGILLAVIAFVATIVLFGQRQPLPSTEPETLPTVYARTNIPLGTLIAADMVETRPLEVSVRPADAFGDVGLVIGKTVRSDVVAGTLLTQGIFTGDVGGLDIARFLDPGLRAMPVQVGESTGVGTLIRVGDRVDLVLAITGVERFPLVSLDATGLLVPLGGYSSTTTKLLVQDVQVIGTLSPAPASPPPGGAAPASTSPTHVILAVTAQEAEVIRFAQIDGSIMLLLRSPRDFVDPSGNPLTPSADVTSGIVLRVLIEDYGVLPPELILTTLPAAVPGPAPSPTPPPTPTPVESPTPSPSPSP